VRVLKFLAVPVNYAAFLEPLKHNLLDSRSLEAVVNNIVYEILALNKVVQEGLHLIVVVD
jgi:hypothetical protein